jgi:uncharacterized membrane protein AbrB (regulator of aidB expression)
MRSHAFIAAGIPADTERSMSTFAIYLIGMLIVIGGLAYLATLLHVPTPWIIGGAVVLLGIGVLGGATKTRRKDPPE